MNATGSLFAGANALIFGGAKGIGCAVAHEFARRGARVAIADINLDAAQATASAIVAAGGQGVAVQVDVLSAESMEAAAHSCTAQLGAPSIVMNNVGSMLNGNPEDVPMAEWQRLMDINYYATLRSVQLFLPQFQAQGRGHIVNTASFAGLYPYATTRMPYVAAKSAVIALTQSLALYLEPQGVRVSCLIPGPVATDIASRMTTWTPDCPMRGPGAELEVKDVAHTAMVLADGMENGRIMISSDEAVWDIVRRWAESPDAFLRAKMAEFASGNNGSPRMPDALKKQLGL